MTDSKITEQADQQPESLVQIRGLYKKFNISGDFLDQLKFKGGKIVREQEFVHAINGVNLDIQKGEALCVVGESGCGKSTLLNCIAGLEPITGGSISIGGKDMTHVSPKDRDIAMVFQSYALYPTMTVAKNITFGMKVRGIDQATQDQKLDHSGYDRRQARPNRFAAAAPLANVDCRENAYRKHSPQQAACRVQSQSC